MERHFDEELKILKERLLYASGIAQQMISDSVKSLTDRNEALIPEIYKKEDEINRLEIEIDDMAVKMMALHQPTAIDLRFLVGAIKINNEIERMGDMAVNICQAAAALIKQPPLKPLLDIPRMAEIAGEMVKDSLDAFVRQDAVLAKKVCERDDEVDDLKDQIFRELLTFMITDPNSIERAMDLILVSRHLERIGDHATNIGEEVIFMVKGQDIRHHFAEQEDKK
jgi:phosphate transport system protein